MNRRVVLTTAAMGTVVLMAIGYLVVTGGRAAPGAAAGELVGPGLTVVELADGANRVETVPITDPAGARSPTGLSCLRVYAAAGITVCLRISGPGPSYAATVSGADGKALREVALPGIPSRARVSASGRIVMWTSFVSGDSYSVPGGFSTRMGFLDLRTGQLTESVEHFTVDVDGAPFSARDINFWGMTVAADDRTFYATMASGDRNWLVKGDLITKSVQSVRQRAECPSLSPDGSRIAYKKRVSRLGPWELAVLDLATGVERALPGTAGIDDQAEWIDGSTLAYAAVPVGGRVAAVFTVPVDGSAPARELVADATSPVAAHG